MLSNYTHDAGSFISFVCIGKSRSWPPPNQVKALQWKRNKYKEALIQQEKRRREYIYMMIKENHTMIKEDAFSCKKIGVFP